MNDAPRELSAVGARIRTLRPMLTALEDRIVEIVWAGPFDETTSLRHLADAAGVSDAMVVKTVKKLGFTGFRDFREQVSS